MPSDDVLQQIIEVYDDVRYPAEFAQRYTIMECLSERPGVDTFLVQDAAGTPYVAKCYDRSRWAFGDGAGGDGEAGGGATGGAGDKGQGAGDGWDPEFGAILSSLDHEGIPKQVEAFHDDALSVLVRAYVPGVSIDRHVRENDLGEQDIVALCVQLCDILAYLHHRPEPIIHRDIKPQNVIVRPDGSVALIDFDIARVYRTGNDADTRFFGTVAYAPPEQYGFAQTDARADIYALGVLLRFLLTGSPRENRNVRVYRPLDKVIRKCTAFDPNDRYRDIDQVKRALLAANPRSRGLRIAGIAVAALLAVGLLAFAGYQVYRAVTWSPFNSDAIPAVLNDEERIDDAVAFLQDKYGVNLFEDADGVATVGLLRRALIELYGLDRDYVYNAQSEGLPGESDEFFMPWGWDDGQTVRKETAVYAAVKVHDPSLVAEDQWGKLEDDNGEYPGARVAMLFAEDTGILTGANRPYDITVGELALIFANADRVFDAAGK